MADMLSSGRVWFLSSEERFYRRFGPTVQLALTNAPLSCACRTSFSVSHGCSCFKVGFPSIRHNDIKDLTVHLLTEVFSDVRVEPYLQSISEGTHFGAFTNATEGA